MYGAPDASNCGVRFAYKSIFYTYFSVFASSVIDRSRKGSCPFLSFLIKTNNTGLGSASTTAVVVFWLRRGEEKCYDY